MAVRQLPVVGRPATASTPLRKIALEEHFVDPAQVQPHFGDSFSAEFDQDGSSYGGFNPEFAVAVTARLNDLREGRIEEMDAAGIDVAILSHTIGGVEGIADPTEAVSAARRVNDFLAAEVAGSGGRFAGFATVALQDVGAAVGELKRSITELGLVGVMVNGYTNPATHVLRMVYGGVFDRHPEANLILGHLGETLPFFAGRIQRAFEYNPYSRRPDKRLQDYLSDNIWLTTSGNFNDQALITALLTVGADHIMFASDYPYDMATDAARWIESAPISENDRRKICHGNAATLFGLSESPS